MGALQRLAGRLMGPFQEAQMRLKERSPLHLLCAAYHGPGNSDAAATEVRWSFTPRGSAIPIALEGFSNELKFSQVLHDQHDGVYNCSSRNDYQVSVRRAFVMETEVEVLITGFCVQGGMSEIICDILQEIYLIILSLSPPLDLRRFHLRSPNGPRSHLHNDHNGCYSSHGMRSLRNAPTRDCLVPQRS